MRYEIEVQDVFSAAHALRLLDGSMEPMHGHDWRVTVCLGADTLDAMETVTDFHPVHAALETVLAPWRNQCLNDKPPFLGAGDHPAESGLAINPSAERVAQAVAEGLAVALFEVAQPEAPRPRVLWARVTEAAGCAAVFRP
ncbi:MAG: 6-carboxytetrahydropterin synthase [Planctomycetota bacterium]